MQNSARQTSVHICIYLYFSNSTGKSIYQSTRTSARVETIAYYLNNHGYNELSYLKA